MRRLFIPLANVDPFDWMHFPCGDDFKVDAEADGQTTEQHKEGIEYIKKVIREGQKVRPILVADNEDGTYKRLDGFKRFWAQKELGEKFIEAFVCSAEEFRRTDIIPYGNGEMRCWHGGQPKEEHGLFEGGESESFKYDDVEFLYKSPDGSGLRIEACEAIHIHWGEAGKQRFIVGRKDFEALAEAIAAI